MRLIALLTLFAASLPCVAQSNPCSLKERDAPEVRGFKLGLPFNEVRKSLPYKITAQREVDELGARKVDISVDLRVDREFSAPWTQRFEGVEGVSLIFLDDALAFFELRYDSSTKWNDPLEFTAAIASSLKLPKKGWRGRMPTFLDCDGFTVETVGELRTLRIMLRNLPGELVTRKYENERKKREAFKP